MGRVEALLDEAFTNRTNLIIIGPAIGKSKRIEAWADEKRINTFDYLPWRHNIVYQENTADGILVIDSPTSYDVKNLIPGALSKAISNLDSISAEFAAYGKHREPNILFTVVVLSSYDDCIPFFPAITDMVSGVSGWKVETLSFDKYEQFPFFIEEQDILIGDFTKNGQEICDRINKSIGKSVATPETKIKLHTRLKRILTYLLESPDFNTYLPHDTSFGLTNFALSHAINDCRTGEKTEFISNLPPEFEKMAQEALIHYND